MRSPPLESARGEGSPCSCSGSRSPVSSLRFEGSPSLGSKSVASALCSSSLMVARAHGRGGRDLEPHAQGDGGRCGCRAGGSEGALPRLGFRQLDAECGDDGGGAQHGRRTVDSDSALELGDKDGGDRLELGRGVPCAPKIPPASAPRAWRARQAAGCRRSQPPHRYRTGAATHSTMSDDVLELQRTGVLLAPGRRPPQTARAATRPARR